MIRSRSPIWLVWGATLAGMVLGCSSDRPIDMWIAKDRDAGAGFEVPVREVSSGDSASGVAGSDGTGGAGGDNTVGSAGTTGSAGTGAGGTTDAGGDVTVGGGASGASAGGNGGNS